MAQRLLAPRPLPPRVSGYRGKTINALIAYLETLTPQPSKTIRPAQWAPYGVSYDTVDVPAAPFMNYKVEWLDTTATGAKVQIGTGIKATVQNAWLDYVIAEEAAQTLDATGWITGAGQASFALIGRKPSATGTWPDYWDWLADPVNIDVDYRILALVFHPQGDTALGGTAADNAGKIYHFLYDILYPPFTNRANGAVEVVTEVSGGTPTKEALSALLQWGR